LAVSTAAQGSGVGPPSARDPFLWAWTAAYAAAYFALGATRYAGHRNFVDLGIFAQTADSAFGCFCNAIEGSHWAFHFSPILYVAGAVMRLWHSALALVALQAIAGALTIPPVYGLVARHTGDRRSARLAAVVVALYPALAGVTFDDFHENVFAPAAIAWLLWAFDGGHAIAAMAFAAVSLTIKEDQAIFIAAASALGAVRYRGTTRGPLAIGIGVIAAAVAARFFWEVQPHAAHFAHWQPERFYAWTAQDVRALIPGGLLARAGFLLLALAPLAFLPWRGPAAVLTILPFAEVVASRMPSTFTLTSHYAGAWIGWCLYAFCVALRRVHARGVHRAHRLLYWCIALCIAEFAVADPLHPGYFLHAPAARDRALDAFLSTLPPNLPVATQEEAYTHLAAVDPNAGLFPDSASQTVRACWMLVDRDYPESPRLQEYGAQAMRLVSTGTYRLVRRSGAISLYMRTRGCR
jgi:uncharacterized membrane protein